jgi:single-stranded DNA-binding protein
MIDGLVAGRVVGEPEKRVGKADTVFVIAKVKCTAGDGESCIVNVIAFDNSVCRELLLVRDGDSVSLTGSLTPKVWTDKQGVNRPVLDMVANRVVTLQTD